MRLLLTLIFFSFFARAQQVPYLERKVNLNTVNVPLTELFKSISRQCGVVFSYTQFDDQRKLTISCSKRPLRLVLNDILKESGCGYKLKDKYIILKCDKPSPSHTLQGYIYSAGDSSVVQGASIYIKQNKFSAVSNRFGYFKLNYPDAKTNLLVSVARESYYDTTLVVYDNLKNEVVVYLYPRNSFHDSLILPRAPLISADTNLRVTHHDTLIIPTPRYFNYFLKLFGKVNTSFRNIKDTLFSNVALTFVPYLSTNRLLSVNTVNKVSFNVLIGYSKGVDAFELGGLLNIDNGDVKYAQIAGIANIVNGNVNGVQIAGITNLNSGSTRAVQLAGITNANKGYFEGISIAGINTIGSKGFRGISVSGINNMEREHFTGIQLSGINNIARSIRGVQVSGISNLTDSLNGIQVAGIVNRAKESDGLQISALINQAGHLKGVQLGILNFADTASGIPVGLLSFVKKGLHQAEVATDETQFVTAGFRTGVDKFHNIIFAGATYSGLGLYSYGYGLGTSFKIHKRLMLGADLSTQALFTQETSYLYANTLNKLQLRVDYRIAQWFAISLGPVLNVQVSDLADPMYTTTYSKLSPYSLYNKSQDGFNTRIWLGARLAVKFF